MKIKLIGDFDFPFYQKFLPIILIILALIVLIIGILVFIKYRIKKKNNKI